MVNPLHIIIHIGNAHTHLATTVITGLSIVISLYFLQKNIPIHISGIVAMLITLTGLNTTEIIYGVLIAGVQKMIGTIQLYGLTVIGFISILVTIDNYYPFIKLDRKIVICCLLQVVAFYWLCRTGYFIDVAIWMKDGQPVLSDPSNLPWLITKVLSYCIPMSIIDNR